MPLLEITSVLAIIIGFASVFSYVSQMATNKSTPNPASFMVWTIIFYINVATYIFVISNNFWLTLAHIISVVVFTYIPYYALKHGKFTKLGKTERVNLFISIAVLVIWQLTNDAVIANLLLQSVFIISTYPLLKNIYVEKGREYPASWIIGSSGHFLLFLGALTILNQVGWPALVAPAIGFLRTITIAIFSMIKWGHLKRQCEN